MGIEMNINNKKNNIVIIIASIFHLLRDCTKFCVKFENLSLIDKIFIKKGFLFYEKETSKSDYWQNNW